MDEKRYTESVPKKLLTKGLMVAVVAVGGIMLLLSIVIPTESQSTAHTIKVIVGMLGVCIIIVGLYFRPGGMPNKSKE